MRRRRPSSTGSSGSDSSSGSDRSSSRTEVDSPVSYSIEGKKGFPGECNNEKDPVTLELLRDLPNERIVVVTIGEERQCYFLESLCSIAREAMQEGASSISLPYGRLLSRRAELKISRLREQLQATCPDVFLAAERPLSQQVDRHMVVKMLLFLKALERSWFMEDVERGSFYLPELLFTATEVESLAQLRFIGGETIPVGFAKLLESCASKNKFHICTKHAVLPFYLKAFFGDRDGFKAAMERFQADVQRLQTDLKTRGPGASSSSAALPVPPRATKQEKQALKAEKKRRKL